MARVNLQAPRPHKIPARPQRKTIRVPFRRLRAIARVLFLSRTVESVFSPLIDEYCCDYIKALASKDPWWALSVRCRVYLAFWLAVTLYGPGSVVRSVVGIVKDVGALSGKARKSSDEGTTAD